MEEGEPGAAAPGMGAVTETDRNASGPLPPPAVAEAEEAQGKPLDHFISVMTADLNSIFDELLLDNLPPGRDPFGEQPPATSEVGSSSGASASSDPTSATGDGPAPSDAARKTPSRMGSLNDFFDICEMELQEGAARSTASANSAIDQPLSRETSASDLMLGNVVLAARASVAAVGVARALVASREAEVLSRFDQWVRTLHYQRLGWAGAQPHMARMLSPTRCASPVPTLRLLGRHPRGPACWLRGATAHHRPDTNCRRSGAQSCHGDPCPRHWRRRLTAPLS